MVAGIFLSEVY